MNLRRVTNLKLSWEGFRRVVVLQYLRHVEELRTSVIRDVHRADAVRQTEVT